MHPKTLRKLGIKPGGHVRLTTKRGSVVVMARMDRGVSEDMVFLPFAYVEVAANILTNSALDTYGKIPEFKFSAVKANKVYTFSDTSNLLQNLLDRAKVFLFRTCQY